MDRTRPFLSTQENISVGYVNIRRVSWSACVPTYAAFFFTLLHESPITILYSLLISGVGLRGDQGDVSTPSLLGLGFYEKFES